MVGRSLLVGYGSFFFYYLLVGCLVFQLILYTFVVVV